MKVLIIYANLSLGGIETFIVRIASELRKQNKEVNVLFFHKNFDEKLVQELKLNANIFFWDDFSVFPSITRKLNPLLKLLFPLKIQKIRSQFSGVTHIHAPDVLSILFSQRLNNIFKNIPLSTGVYHINEFNIEKLRKWYFAKVIYKFIHKLPERNMLFFNEISLKVYNKLFNKKFDEKLISPIGIDLNKVKKNLSGVKNNKIISVGRLASWKTYNFHMIQVIYELKQRGHDVYYESYGDGDSRRKLEELVNKLDLSQRVFFYSEIEYEKFQETINNSLMFIGAGTALIEAAACGIPALIGIENEQEPLTYGFLHETKSYSYQENNLDKKKHKIVDYIEGLLMISEDEYKKLCLLSRKRAYDFDMKITANKFSFLISESTTLAYNLNFFQLIFFMISLLSHKLVSIFYISKKSYFNRL